MKCLSDDKNDKDNMELIISGPYSLLVRASYFISYSVYARSTSVILSFANGAGGVGVF